MTIFSDAVHDILNDPGMKTAAIFRTATLYGHFINRSEVIDGVRTRIIAFEFVSNDLDQAPAVGDKITIDDVAYDIIDVEDDYDCASTYLVLRRSI